MPPHCANLSVRQAAHSTIAARFVECLRDPKTWLFAFFSAFDNVPNSLTNQQQLIIANFGFSTLQTTLLGLLFALLLQAGLLERSLALGLAFPADGGRLLLCLALLGLFRCRRRFLLGTAALFLCAAFWWVSWSMRVGTALR